jgi:hypothetical protein
MLDKPYIWSIIATNLVNQNRERCSHISYSLAREDIKNSQAFNLLEKGHALHHKKINALLSPSENNLRFLTKRIRKPKRSRVKQPNQQEGINYDFKTDKQNDFGVSSRDSGRNEFCRTSNGCHETKIRACL